MQSWEISDNNFIRTDICNIWRSPNPVYRTSTKVR